MIGALRRVPRPRPWQRSGGGSQRGAEYMAGFAMATASLHVLGVGFRAADEPRACAGPCPASRAGLALRAGGAPGCLPEFCEEMKR